MVEKRSRTISLLARESMLRMAGVWESLGQVNQAIDIYLRIVREHPDSVEAEDAKGRLLKLAMSLEWNGQYRRAMELYDRIERACRC